MTNYSHAEGNVCSRLLTLMMLVKHLKVKQGPEAPDEEKSVFSFFPVMSYWNKAEEQQGNVLTSSEETMHLI